MSTTQYTETFLDHVVADSERRLAGYRESARKAVKAAAGGGASAVLESMASTVGGAGNSIFGGDARLIGASKQYAAAMRDYPFTAIRPVAVKVADQVLRVGRKAKPKPTASKLRTKSHKSKLSEDAAAEHRRSLAVKRAPEFVKAISEGVDVIEGHPLLNLIENPNPYMTRWALMYCTAFSIEACGEAVWILDPTRNPDSGEVEYQIWYYPRSWVQPVHDDERGIPYVAWKLTPPGVSKEFPDIPAELVVHFNYPDPSNPLAALSPVQSQSRAVNTDDQIQQAQLASMRNAIRPGVMIIAGEMDPLPGQAGRQRIELTPEQRKQIITAVRLAYRGVQHFGDPIILDRLIQDVKPYMPSPADLDFPNGSMLTKDRIMQGIGTNPIVAGQVEGANRASAYVAQDMFYAVKVNPLISCMSETMTRKLGPLFSTEGETSEQEQADKAAAMGEKLVVWLEEAKPHDADLELAQMTFLAGQGWLRPSEAREAFDLPPDDMLEEQWEEAKKAPPTPPPGAGMGPQKPGAAPMGGAKPPGKPEQAGKELSVDVLDRKMFDMERSMERTVDGRFNGFLRAVESTLHRSLSEVETRQSAVVAQVRDALVVVKQSLESISTATAANIGDLRDMVLRSTLESGLAAKVVESIDGLSSSFYSGMRDVAKQLERPINIDVHNDVRVPEIKQEPPRIEIPAPQVNVQVEPTPVMITNQVDVPETKVTVENNPGPPGPQGPAGPQGPKGDRGVDGKPSEVNVTVSERERPKQAKIRHADGTQSTIELQ